MWVDGRMKPDYSRSRKRKRNLCHVRQVDSGRTLEPTLTASVIRDSRTLTPLIYQNVTHKEPCPHPFVHWLPNNVWFPCLRVRCERIAASTQREQKLRASLMQLCFSAKRDKVYDFKLKFVILKSRNNWNVRCGCSESCASAKRE